MLAFALATVVFIFVPKNVQASLAGIWRFPLDLAWNIDPEFQFGSVYQGVLHLGEDVEGPAGTPVYAAANGVVRRLANFPAYHDYGGVILIEHLNVTGSNVVSLYGHLDPNKFRVQPGQVVSRGQLIGHLGSRTVNGDWKTHLHFALRRGTYVSSPWVYFGFGDSAMLRQWEPASEYVAGRAGITEVLRLPEPAPTRYDTAAGISRQIFPAGDSAGAVILASGEEFTGALASASLSRQKNAPIILTRRLGLPSASIQEIDRVLPSGGTVYAIGDNGRISEPVLDLLRARGYVVTRIGTGSAAQTAVGVAQQLATHSTAFLVSDTAFADGISAGGPSATLGYPILLTNSQSLSTETRTYLVQQGITRVIIVGGPAAVASQIEVDIRAALPTAQIDRTFGADRYETNRRTGEMFVSSPTHIAIATGQAFPDAITVSSLAAAQNGVVILTKQASLPSAGSSLVSLYEPSVQLAWVVGGSTAVNAAVDLAVGKLLNPDYIGSTSASSSSSTSSVPQNNIFTDFVMEPHVHAHTESAAPAHGILPSSFWTNWFK